jgi:5'-3' exonuclease
VSGERLLNGPDVVLCWDISGLAWRMAHAGGDVARAVLVRCARELERVRPGYAVACQDLAAPTWRHRLSPAYKADRKARFDPAKREAVRVAVVEALELLADVLGVSTVAQAGYEADDLCAGVVGAARARGLRTVVSSSDKDLLQLVAADVRVVQGDGVVVTADDVLARFGVMPDAIPDWLAIVGDAADGYAGVRGVGAKGAATVLVRWRTLDAALAWVDADSWWTERATLAARMRVGAESARLALQLARLAVPPGGHPVDAWRLDAEVPAVAQSLR